MVWHDMSCIYMSENKITYSCITGLLILISLEKHTSLVNIGNVDTYSVMFSYNDFEMHLSHEFLYLLFYFTCYTFTRHITIYKKVFDKCLII